MKVQNIKLTKIVQNKGQIEGLPKNPRLWTEYDLERLVKSLEETPELTEARGCIVYPYEGRYVILGGNMRYAAAKKLEWKEISCCVLDEDTPVEKLREIVIKDNGSWGAWDMDELANKWPQEKLEGWGISLGFLGNDSYEDEGAAESQEPAEKADERMRVIITFPDDLTERLEEIIGMNFNPEKPIIKAEQLVKEQG